MTDIDAVVSFALAHAQGSVLHDLKKGLLPSTESYAYKHILPLVNTYEEPVALRVAGLIASTGIPHNKEVSFGRWCAIHDLRTAERKLPGLVHMDLENAIRTIDRVIRQIGSQDGFDWYGLARTLQYWGNGIDAKSIQTRQKILRDLWRAPREAPNPGEESSAA